MSQDGNIKTCTKCGGIMVKRSGKYGAFFGCANYPRCKHTEKIQYVKESVKLEESNQVESDKNWSHYQVAIFDAVKDINCNIGIEATAGSGKSTVLKECAKILRSANPEADIIALVFGRDAAADLNKKMGGLIDARTSHSLALYNVKHTADYKKSVVDSEKYYKIFQNYVKFNESDKDGLIRNRTAILSTIDLIRDLMLDTSIESIEYISSHYDRINFNGDTRIIINAIDNIYRMGINDKTVLDFGDMLILCAKNPSYCKKYDYILLDEAQDSNQAQLNFYKNSLKENGKIIFVGDSSQGIYGFRGSLSDAMGILKDNFNAKMMPLSVTYRCPIKHVEYIKSLLPDSKIESAPGAIDGEIIFGKFNKFFNDIADGSLLLCRNNAPLIKPAFKLLSSGRKVIIKGKNIGLDLINLILKIKKLYGADSIYELAEGINQYRSTESEKLTRLNYLKKLDSLLDNLDCINAFLEDSDTIDTMIKNIDRIFSDDSTQGLTFSSVHKAKGLESDNVYIIGPELMPSSKAKTEEDKIQESNIMFVAYTRSKRNLYIVETEKN